MVDIDQLKPKKSLINLDDPTSDGDISKIFDEDYELSFLFDDIILVEYIDERSDEVGDTVVRGGIHIPTNALNRAWRKGRIILKGPKTEYVNIGSIVVFPNNVGMTISNVNIKGKGKLRKGIFLNEARLFGICEHVTCESSENNYNSCESISNTATESS